MNYGSTIDPPPPSFWNQFPKNLEKSSPSTKGNVDKFSNLISHCKNKWSARQKIIAFRSLKTLKFGNKTIFKKNQIPSFHSPNANSAFRHGKCITDTVASWIKKEYVIGTFHNPPFKNFNTSPLMAAVQKTKVRPILNLSAPPGSSFNDAISKNHLQKIFPCVQQKNSVSP